MTREDLKNAVIDAIKSHGGKATVVQVAKYIWENYEDKLRGSGDFFYKWQYETRWAANILRNEGLLEPVDATPKGVWAIRS